MAWMPRIRKALFPSPRTTFTVRWRGTDSHGHTMANPPLTPEDLERYQARLQALIMEHRDLDQVISHLAENPPPDQLLVPRLKKRKLQLRDQIWEVEALLTPDEPA